MGISGIHLLLKERRCYERTRRWSGIPEISNSRTPLPSQGWEDRGGNGATGPMAELCRARSPEEHMQVSAAMAHGQQGEGQKGAAGQQPLDGHLWRTGTCLLSTQSFLLHVCMVHCAGFLLQWHVKLCTSRWCCTFSDRPYLEARRLGAGTVPMMPGSWATLSPTGRALAARPRSVRDPVYPADSRTGPCC